jgi:O-methyltransferase involved in polyketide biosynthesis
MVEAINNYLLDGVSETALWTLRSRAVEAMRSDGLIVDPWAVSACDAIRYDYAKFGKPVQYHVLRALAFDDLTKEFLGSNPNARVVALAEGFQTSFWRLQSDGSLNGATWYSVDLPAVVSLRQAILPSDDNLVSFGMSALDRDWMDYVDSAGGPVLITAEGLLMYLRPKEALDLIADCAERFPGGRMIFDAIPPRYSRRTQRGVKLSSRYTLPPMPFSLSADERMLLGGIPGVRALRSQPLAAGRGFYKALGWRPFERIEPFRSMGPLVLDFE